MPIVITLISGTCDDSHPNPVAHGVAATYRGPCRSTRPRASLNLGTNAGVDQHQFTDSPYGAPGSGHLDKTVVPDGVTSPEEFDANGESACYCA